MKTLLFVLVLASCVTVAAQPNPAPAASSAATFIDAEKVAAAFAKGGPIITPEGTNYRVLAGRRDSAPGQAEVHAVDADVMYVLEGTATFITGGKVTDAKNTAADEVRGSGVTGGETHQLKKGDVVIVPKNVPHWFKEVSPPFLYFVVKVR